MTDPVNSPAHYTFGAIDCLEAIESSMETNAYLGFLKGNVIKYLWRYEKKNGSEDLHKASFYLKQLIAIVEEKENKVEKLISEIAYDPDSYMVQSGCPDGFCPLPGVRHGPSEPMFKAIDDSSK